MPFRNSREHHSSKTSDTTIDIRQEHKSPFHTPTLHFLFTFQKSVVLALVGHFPAISMLWSNVGMLPTPIREVERHPRMNTVNANSRADVVGSFRSCQKLRIESEELLLCFLVRDSHKTYFYFALIRQPAISFLYQS